MLVGCISVGICEFLEGSFTMNSAKVFEDSVYERSYYVESISYPSCHCTVTLISF
jgi:hypothetical protein